MKGKAKISNQDSSPHSKNIYTLAYNKFVEDIRRGTEKKKHDTGDNDSVDFETAISKAGYGKFNYLLLLLTIPAASSSGWVTGAMSFVLPVASCDMNLTSLDKAWLNSAAYSGMIISAFFWGFLSDTFGRQRLLTFGFLADSIMGMCASFSSSLWPMIFFKTMSGMMVCGPYSIFMAYISEVFMDKYRNFAVSTSGIFSAIGNLMQPAFAWLLIPAHLSWTLWDGYDYSTWRLFLFISSIPSLICGIASAFCVESPKFLLEKGRKEEALNAIKTIYTINTGKPNNTYPVHKLHDMRPQACSENEKQISFWKVLQNGSKQVSMLLKPPFIYTALLLFLIQLGSVSSLNAIRLWLPQIFSAIDTASAADNSTTSGDQGLCVKLTEAAKNTSEVTCEDMVIKPDLYMNMIFINCSGLITQTVYVILLKYVQKKTLMTVTTAVSAVCMIALPMVSTNFIVLLTACIFSLLNMTFFCVVGTLVEVFPTTVRATIVSLTMMCGRIGILFANVGVASIMYTHCNAIFYATFALLAVISISSLFLSAKPITFKNNTAATSGA